MKIKICSIILISFILAGLSAVDVTIYEIQFTTSPSGDSPYAGQVVTTTGIVTGTGFAGYNDNFFISEPTGGAWKGVYIYDADQNVDMGDEIEITGTVSEYFGLTEIGLGTVTVLSTGNPLPEPVSISTAELASEEQYEGVLVKVENVTVTALPNSYGEWFVSDGSSPCQIDDGFYQYPNVQSGEQFTSITGLVDYSFNEYGLHPRNASDLVSGGEDTTPPTLSMAVATSATGVNLTFSEQVSAETAENIANYLIAELTISAVTLQANNMTVSLTTDEQTPGISYTIIVNSVEDLAGNPIAANSTIGFIGFTAGDTENVFFSEYIEGSSNNKALEIYNGGSNAVDLSEYEIWRISNGGDWAEGQSNAVALSGILDPGDVFVICNSGASAEIQAVSDLIGTTATYYNGNDAVGLAHNGVLIDAIGEEGPDVGTAWDVAGVPNATLDHTLVRKSAVTQGNLNWPAAAGTNADNSEWIVYNLDDFSHLGSHEGSGEDTTPPTLNSATATSATGVQLSFSEQVSAVTAENTANYQIDGLTISTAALQGNGITVSLTTSEQTPGQYYTITVSNVEDLAGNPIAANSTIGFSGFTAGGTENVFFSEYIEGSSNNKALEIYNGGESAVDLSAYEIWRISNGGDWTEGQSNAVALSGILAPGDVFVICNSGANAEIQAVSDLIGTTATYYNGNDAVGLAHNGVLIDAIGEEGPDVGTAWDVAGVPNATLDHTLVRKSTVTQGNLDWSAAAGTNTNNSEWIVYNLDDFSHLGSHEGSGEDTTPPALTSATATSLSSVNLIFSESLDETSAEIPANYSILPTLSITAASLSGNRVTLSTAEQTPGQMYTVTVTNVEDLAGNVIAGNNTANFTGYQGVVYDLIADIQADPQSYEGQTVTIHGIVTIGVNVIQTGNTNAYVQDNSGRGINIYNYTTINDLVRGNEVVITGTVTEYESSSGNSTTEITNPQVSVLSTGNPQPTPLDLDLSDTDMLELEGTLLRVRGVIYEVYSAGGGDNLNIRDTAGNTITVRVWGTTGINTSQFTVGFNLEAIGVGSEYSDKLQLVPGYQDQLGEVQDLDDNVTLDPEQPAAGEAVTVTYNSLDETSSALIFWKTGGDHLFETDWMDSLSAYSFQYVIPAQPEGTTVYFYLLINEPEASFTIPEEAPADLMSYTVAVTSHQAILNLPPHPFDPYAGEEFPIEYACLPGDKAILRIYNAEGKLVFTAKNEIVSSGSGVQTFHWDGRDAANKLLPLGLYICHLEVVATATGKTRSKTAPIVIGTPLK